jgi:spore coat protein U domain-containing protein, fimbrial subunit CupE1/2/3/6
MSVLTDCIRAIAGLEAPSIRGTETLGFLGCFFNQRWEVAKMLYRKLTISAALAVAAGFGIATSAWAATATSTVTVSASVSQNCTVSTASVAFGAYDPVSANAATDLVAAAAPLTVTCTKGASGVTIDLGQGGHYSAPNRRMSDGTDFLNYQLYMADTEADGAACHSPPSGGAGIWGSTSGGSVLTPVTPSWSATTGLVFNICGVVPQAQDVGVGTYNDSVTATVTF